MDDASILHLCLSVLTGDEKNGAIAKSRQRAGPLSGSSNYNSNREPPNKKPCMGGNARAKNGRLGL